MRKTSNNKVYWPLTILRILLGAVFIVSAVAKFIDIDPFELYVFSYGFFSLNVADVLVRLCIAAELILGIFIILGWYRRLVKTLTLLMLVFFTLFLCYAALRGRMESCQCFGQLVDFNPIQSIVKNAILILLVLIAYRNSSLITTNSSLKKLLLSAGIVAVVTAAIFIISVPDSWMFRESRSSYNQQTLAESISQQGVLASRHLDQGHHLVAFVTPGCPFCQMSRQKIGSIADRHDIDTTLIDYVEPVDVGDSIFMRITYGQRPLVVLLDDGEVVATYHYRNISERQIADFLR